MTATCIACHTSSTARGRNAKTCSAKCRKRLSRNPYIADDADYVVTDEDRAAIRRVLEADDYGCPFPPLTPEQVRAHIAANATHT